jgi:hypothetical protein
VVQRRHSGFLEVTTAFRAANADILNIAAQFLISIHDTSFNYCKYRGEEKAMKQTFIEL